MDYDHLIQSLSHAPLAMKPVIMPDFFLDHFVLLGRLDEFIQNVKMLAGQGGGNLLGSTHLIRRGGNSVNTASALFQLGLSPQLIVTTDSQGSSLLRSLVDSRLDLSHIHEDGSLAATASLEMDFNGRRVNIMVSDSGSVADFSFDMLTDVDLKALQETPLIALLCLNHNRRAAQLASDIFSFVREHSDAITFMDMGDPSGNAAIVKPLCNDVLAKGLVDILSVNENEVRWFANNLAGTNPSSESEWSSPEGWMSAAQLVARNTGVRVDLHTPFYSASVHDDTTVAVPAFNVYPVITCGAGDTWNAGDIFSTLQKLPDDDRLVLSNAAAALYVASEDALHPTPEDIIEFLSENPSLNADGKNLLKHK